MVCHILLQEIFLTQGSNLGLLHYSRSSCTPVDFLLSEPPVVTSSSKSHLYCTRASFSLHHCQHGLIVVFLIIAILRGVSLHSLCFFFFFFHFPDDYSCWYFHWWYFHWSIEPLYAFSGIKSIHVLCPFSM